MFSLAMAVRTQRLALGASLAYSLLFACGGSTAAGDAATTPNPLAKDAVVSRSDANCVWLNDCNAAAYPSVSQCSLTQQELMTKEKPFAEGDRSACSQAQIDLCVKDVKASRCPATGLAAAGSLPSPASCNGC